MRRGDAGQPDDSVRRAARGENTGKRPSDPHSRAGEPPASASQIAAASTVFGPERDLDGSASVGGQDDRRVVGDLEPRPASTRLTTSRSQPLRASLSRP